MRFRAIAVSVLIVGLCSIALWLIRYAQPPTDTPGAIDRPIIPKATGVPPDERQRIATTVQSEGRPIAVPNSGFVASASCQACHEDQYDSWHASYHRRMTQLATPDAVIGDFNASDPIRAYGREFLLSQRDSQFWVSMLDLESTDAAETETVERQIVMTTGSHHMQIYWYSTFDPKDGRSLWQLPIAWLRETQSWVPTSALFISPPPQPLRIGKRRWNEVCIKCHTTNGQPQIDNGPEGIHVDTKVAEFGISCEACHGPGEAHVQAQSQLESGEERTVRRSADPHQPTAEDTSRSIVQPSQLSHERSAEVCGQCHGNWLPSDESSLAEFYKSGTCFRAGDNLRQSRHVFSSGQSRTEFIQSFLKSEPHYFEDRFWKDGMIRVSGGEFNGMTNSPCFASKQFSCLSCHQMHQSAADSRPVHEWANDQLDATKLGQEACLQCHEEFRSEKQLQAHTHHRSDSTGSSCYNCHMPHTSYGLLKAIRSHQISVPSVQESTDLGRPNACNQCHIDKTLAWTGEHLQAWYGIAAPANLTNDQRIYSASALWCLTGDAGARALAAWTLGWPAAQEASRTDWSGAVLAQMLADPYDAVRHIAHRSLKTLPDFADFDFYYPAASGERQKAAVRAFQIWQRQERKRGKANPSLLLTPGGELDRNAFTRLNHQRDNKQVLLAE